MLPLLQLAVYCSDKCFRHALEINAAPEAMRLSKSQLREKMHDGAEAMSPGSSSEVCLSFVSTGVREGKGGT